MLLVLTGTRLQDRQRAFPNLGARRLSGRADAGDGVSGGGQQGGGICAVVARALCGIAAGQRAFGRRWSWCWRARRCSTAIWARFRSDNIKRLLGYSSIGHAGYMLMGVAAVNALGAGAVLFYLGQYAFTNPVRVSRDHRGDERDRQR